MAGSQFGPTSAGYLRPTLAELIDQERNLLLAAIPSLTFAAGSPELAIIEAQAKLRNDEWEARECAFFSFDINNQSGCALDVAAGLQGFTRLADETDDEFKARINDDDSGSGFITDIERGVRALEDVCRVTVYNNTSGIDDASTGNPSGSFEVVYQGGDPTQIAGVVWECSSGATNLGQQSVDYEDNDGICRQVRLTEAQEVPYCVRLTIDAYQTRGGCENQTLENIEQAAFDALSSKDIPIGGPVLAGDISGSIYANVSGIDIVSVEFAPSSVDASGNCTCDNVQESDWQLGSLVIDPREIATFDRSCIVIIARDR